MWVKICGITDPALATAVARLQPDAIGLNFYEKSKRCVTPSAAKSIVSALPATVEPVGVFVNCPRSSLESLCEVVGIKTIQLHGDESPEFIASLRGHQIIRAFRVGADGLAPVQAYLDECVALGVTLRGCLIDAHVPGAFGGTGQIAPWELLRSWDHAHWPPLILAGGLTPENVAQAIALVRPHGVDVASGVEVTPGQQSIDLVGRFITAARAPR